MLNKDQMFREFNSIFELFRLIISVPPQVLIPPGNHAVTLAQRVILSCSVGGDPAPTIIWTKNGRPVILDHRIQQLQNGSLVIYDSTVSHESQS